MTPERRHIAVRERDARRATRVASALLAVLLAFYSVWVFPAQNACADVRADTDTINGAPVSSYSSQTNDFPDVVADYAAVCAQDGTILWERGGTTQTPMASTTKIMTAIVGLENCSLDTMMTVTAGAVAVGGSTANLQAGDKVSFGDLLYALMLPSGNDAAVTIAENISGMEQDFVTLMNQKAQQLGMTNTHFNNASGIYDDDHYTTVEDYLKLARYAMQNQTFRQVVDTQSKTIDINGRSVTYQSTDELFKMMDGVEGIKTGFTTAAGYCLVSACVQNGIELYTVVFHSSSETQRFVDAKALLQWGFRHYRSFELINTSQQVAQMGLSSWIDKSVAVFVPNDVDLTLFDLDGPISQEIDVSDWSGAINAGDVCGTIIWTQNGQVIATSNLVAAASVAAPDFWSGIQIFFQRLFGNFTGAQKNEPTQVLLDAQLNVPVTQAPAD